MHLRRSERTFADICVLSLKTRNYTPYVFCDFCHYSAAAKNSKIYGQNKKGKSVDKSHFKALGLFLSAVVVSFITLAAADAELAGDISGVGGVMRDVERRALSQPAAKNVEQLPAVSAVVRSEVAKAAIGSQVIGPINQVSVKGSEQFAARERLSERILSEFAANTDITVEEVLAALSRVKADLLKKGYYLARLTLAKPKAYDPATATLTVAVDEGRFGHFTIKFNKEEDGRWFSKRQIERRFESLKEGETFDYSRLRSILFDVNSHPDLIIDTKIDVRKPIEGEGEKRRIVRYADLNLNVRESFPLHMLFEMNNFGVEDVDVWQMALTAQYLNLTKHDDVLTISPAMSLNGALLSAAASYMLPHYWWRGGATTVYGGWSFVDIDDIVPQLDLEGNGWFAGLQHTENLINNDNHLLALSLGLLWRNISDHYTAMAEDLKERSAHILPLSLALSYTGKRPDALGGRNFATVQGLYNLFNGGDALSDVWNDAECNYWLIRAQLARLQSLFGVFDSESEQMLHNWQLFLKVEGQYTNQNLIPVEKLMLGGYNCLRGYRTRGFVGDYGIYGTVELRSPLLIDTFAALFGDRTDKLAFDRLQFLTFCDWGITAYNDLPGGYDTERFLTSLGFGARLAVTKHSQVRCDVAFPLVEGVQSESKDMEVYLSVQLQF